MEKYTALREISTNETNEMLESPSSSDNTKSTETEREFLQSWKTRKVVALEDYPLGPSSKLLMQQPTETERLRSSLRRHDAKIKRLLYETPPSSPESPIGVCPLSDALRRGDDYGVWSDYEGLPMEENYFHHHNEISPHDWFSAAIEPDRCFSSSFDIILEEPTTKLISQDLLDEEELPSEPAFDWAQGFIFTACLLCALDFGLNFPPLFKVMTAKGATEVDFGLVILIWIASQGMSAAYLIKSQDVINVHLAFAAIVLLTLGSSFHFLGLTHPYCGGLILPGRMLAGCASGILPATTSLLSPSDADESSELLAARFIIRAGFILGPLVGIFSSSFTEGSVGPFMIDSTSMASLLVGIACAFYLIMAPLIVKLTSISWKASKLIDSTPLVINTRAINLRNSTKCAALSFTHFIILLSFWSFHLVFLPFSSLSFRKQDIFKIYILSAISYFTVLCFHLIIQGKHIDPAIPHVAGIAGLLTAVGTIITYHSGTFSQLFFACIFLSLGFAISDISIRQFICEFAGNDVSKFHSRLTKVEVLSQIPRILACCGGILAIQNGSLHDAFSISICVLLFIGCLLLYVMWRRRKIFAKALLDTPNSITSLSDSGHWHFISSTI